MRALLGISSTTPLVGSTWMQEPRIRIRKGLYPHLNEQQNGAAPSAVHAPSAIDVFLPLWESASNECLYFAQVGCDFFRNPRAFGASQVAVQGGVRYPCSDESLVGANVGFDFQWELGASRLILGCEHSGLFHQFSLQATHGLKAGAIPQAFFSARKQDAEGAAGRTSEFCVMESSVLAEPLIEVAYARAVRQLPGLELCGGAVHRLSGFGGPLSQWRRAVDRTSLSIGLTAHAVPSLSLTFEGVFEKQQEPRLQIAARWQLNFSQSLISQCRWGAKHQVKRRKMGFEFLHSACPAIYPQPSELEVLRPEVEAVAGTEIDKPKTGLAAPAGGSLQPHRDRELQGSVSAANGSGQTGWLNVQQCVTDQRGAWQVYKRPVVRCLRRIDPRGAWQALGQPVVSSLTSFDPRGAWQSWEQPVLSCLRRIDPRRAWQAWEQPVLSCLRRIDPRDALQTLGQRFETLFIGSFWEKVDLVYYFSREPSQAIGGSKKKLTQAPPPVKAEERFEDCLAVSEEPWTQASPPVKAAEERFEDCLEVSEEPWTQAPPPVEASQGWRQHLGAVLQWVYPFGSGKAK